MAEKSFGIRGSSIQFTHPDMSMPSGIRRGRSGLAISRPQSAQGRLSQHDLDDRPSAGRKPTTVNIQTPRVRGEVKRPASAMSAVSGQRHQIADDEMERQYQTPQKSTATVTSHDYGDYSSLSPHRNDPPTPHKMSYGAYNGPYSSTQNSKVFTTRPVRLHEEPTTNLFNHSRASTQGLRGTARQSMNFIEDSYITNLQQQIQFLEMELDLQKRAVDEQKNDMLKGAAPLDETIEQIRMKFIEKEKAYTDKIDELQKKIPPLQEKVNLQEGILTEKDKKLEQLQSEIINARQNEVDRRTVAVVPLEKQVDDLTTRLQSQQEYNEALLRKNDRLVKDIDELKEKYQGLARSERDLTAQLQSRDQQIKGLEQKVDQYEKFLEKQRIEREQEKYLHQQEMSANSAPELRLQLQEAKQRETQLELEVKKLELEKSQMDAAKGKADENAQQHMSKNITLEKQCNKLMEDVVRYKDQFQKMLQKNEVTQQELSAEKRDTSKLQEQLNHIENLRHGDKEKYEEEMATLKMQLFKDKQLKDELDMLKYQSQQREKHYDDMDKNNLELRNLARNAQEHNISLKVHSAELEKCIAQAELQIVELSTKIEQLQQQINIQDLIRDLKAMPLDKLFASSNNVASVLGDLFGAINKDQQPQQQQQQQQDRNEFMRSQKEKSTAQQGSPVRKQRTFDSWLNDNSK